MTKEEIKNLSMQGIGCSQVVVGQFADELEMQEGLLRKMSAYLGGRMQRGETCGAVAGASMVIGLKHGHNVNNDLRQEEVMREKTSEFKRLFAEKYVRGWYQIHCLTDRERMTLRGCDEDMREWADGNNKLLTQEGILLEGARCGNVKSDYVPNRLGGSLNDAPTQKTDKL